MITTVDLAQKLLSILEKFDQESQNILQNEFLKVVPTEESEVILKAGGGRFPDDNEHSIGIFVQVSHVQENPEYQPLDLLVANLISRTVSDKLAILEQVLTGFENALPPYEFRYMETQIVNETIKAFHFSLIGKMK